VNGSNNEKNPAKYPRGEIYVEKHRTVIMRNIVRLWLTRGLLVPTLFGAAAAQPPALDSFVVARGSLCVTEGVIEKSARDRLMVNVPKMRAYVNSPPSQAIEARFTYLGPTTEESRLGSGEIRRQFGLKLRAQDPCNLVYVMWRIDPESKLVVSVKRNPAAHASAECGNLGYQNIKPRRSVAVPRLRPGDTHTLRAEMNGQELRVLVDNAAIWEGNAGPEALGLAGPVGIRSDNARLEFDLKAAEPGGVRHDHVTECKSGPAQSE
jgi:hypothetical protein